MKKIYILLTGLLILIFSCTEDKIMTYNAGDYIQFSKIVTDSSTCSFLIDPSISEIKYPIAVELVGTPKEVDRKFRLGVLEKLTDAPKANYQLQESYTFRAGKVRDTCWLTIKKTPEIAVKPVRLVVKLEDSGDFKVGQTEYSASIIYISNKASKPNWWNDLVTAFYLGEYSDKKYRLFISLTKKIDIDISNTIELRDNTLVLKYYLQKEKDAGRTVFEEDGREMTVALITG